MSKKLFATVIFAAFFSLLFVSCSTESGEKSTIGDETSNAAIAESGDDPEIEIDMFETLYLPQKDYGGYEFKIVTFEDHISGTNMFIAEEQIGEVLNDALYNRNLSVEDRFNIKIVGVGLAWGETARKVQTGMKSGDQPYDLLAPHMTDACASMLNSGSVYNWLDVPNIDLAKPWYNRSISELVEINGFLPYIVSDFNYGSYPFTYAMVFNKNYVTKYVLENPYDLVRGGDWTLDKFSEMIKMFSEDINGDGKFDVNDSYGYVTDFWLYNANFIYSTGNLCAQKTPANEIELTLYSEKMITLIEKLYDIVHVGNNTFQYDIYAPCTLPIDQNRSFIQSLWLYDLPSMRAMDVEFGILPCPKYDKQQERYLTSVDGRGTVLALPANTEDIERSSVIVEALSAESRRYVVPAYYDISLSIKDARDEESKEMLDILFAGRIYDIGYIYDSGMYWLMGNLLQSKKVNFASEYEKNEKSYQKYYDKISEQYKAWSNQ
ncbi:MAG: hypothetical protein FWG34_09610 [Oscillospiraceae bacterium]|nr:hypothetical protein [Oscillospiraceae bacterium]